MSPTHAAAPAADRSTSPSNSPASLVTRRSWRQGLFAVVAILVGFGLGATRGLAQDQSKEPAAAVVRLTIDYGDGVEKHFTRIPWREGMTALDTLVEAKKHARGVQFEHRGSGETAFVTQIDDLKNEGNGRNWLYRVNDQPGTTSSGIFKLSRDDRVLWKFSTSR